MPKRAKVERSPIVPYGGTATWGVYRDIAARTLWSWDEKGVYSVLAELQIGTGKKRGSSVVKSFRDLSLLVGLSKNKTRDVCRSLASKGFLHIEGYDPEAVWVNEQTGKVRFGRVTQYRYGKPDEVKDPGKTNYCLPTKFRVLQLEKRFMRADLHEKKGIREGKILKMGVL